MYLRNRSIPFPREYKQKTRIERSGFLHLSGWFGKIWDCENGIYFPGNKEEVVKRPELYVKATSFVVCVPGNALEVKTSEFRVIETRKFF
jgi:hypothetical protein